LTTPLSAATVSNKTMEEFILFILQNRIDIIEPAVSPATGILYPKIQPFASKYKLNPLKLLEKAEKMGFLEKEVFDKVIFCPKCGSLRYIARLHCTRCGSKNIKSSRIIVHELCGYAGVELEFKKEDDQLICPNCGQPIGENYQIIGELFTCLDCSHRFPVPDVKFECMDCGNVFNSQESRYMPVHKYKVLPEKVELFVKKVALRNIKDILLRSGYRLLEPPIIAGVSGINHQFDIVGLKNDSKVAISYYDPSTDENIQSHILNLLGKSTDVKDAVIIDLVRADVGISLNGLKLFGGMGNQHIILYESIEELREKLKDKISELSKLSSGE